VFRSSSVRRVAIILAGTLLTLTALAACTPPSKIAARVDHKRATLEVATCEAIVADLIRVSQADLGSSDFHDVWIAVGEHRFEFEDVVAVGQPISGMQVVVEKPIDLSDTARISVSFERWPAGALDQVDDYSEIPGLPTKSIGFNFEVAATSDLWLRADDTMHEEACDRG